MTQEALRIALEALEAITVDVKTTPTAYESQRQAITAIKEALAQTQEPVALQYPQKDIDWQREQQIKAQASTPPQRTEIELVGTVKELFKDSAWNRLNVRGSTKVYLDKDNT